MGDLVDVGWRVVSYLFAATPLPYDDDNVK